MDNTYETEIQNRARDMAAEEDRLLLQDAIRAIETGQVDNVPSDVDLSDLEGTSPVTLDDAEFEKLLNSAIGEAVQEISALVELKNASKTGARRNYYERKIAKLQKRVGPLLASGANWIKNNGGGAING